MVYGTKSNGKAGLTTEVREDTETAGGQGGIHRILMVSQAMSPSRPGAGGKERLGDA